MAAIDLNCDMGEGYGAWRMGDDEALAPLVTSMNVACGFHASDPGTMRRTVRLARRHGVAVGAHPSFPDRVGFGRRDLSATPDEVRDDVTYQIGALWAFCRAEGVALRHVKPHGALYNLAARDERLAAALCEAVRAVDPSLALVGLAGSPMQDVTRRAGVRWVGEAFADRAYAADGTLVPRRAAGAVIRDPAAVAERVARLAQEGRVVAVDGTELAVEAGTVCVHGDTEGAVELARAIRERLAREGIEVRAPVG
ncbi:MAG TPA: 5-oxoprolinase subunit PxpA [Anaeromyxobacteraceae bacterium]|nr:5-oxoprolinase subunit PxpA [Anaeromyxobacteraceae bacterium]